MSSFEIGVIETSLTFDILGENICHVQTACWLKLRVSDHNSHLRTRGWAIYIYFHVAARGKTRWWKTGLQGRKKHVKVGGGGSGFQGHFFIKKRAPSSKFIYGGYTTQLSLKLLNSECL